MTASAFTHTFANGLVLLAESMPWLESAAFTLLLPAGCSHDPADMPGLANFTCEMAQRGCGSRNSRQFVEMLERLGADYSASVSNAHTSFGAAMPAENLLPVLELFADLVLKPQLPAGQIEEARLVCLQELHAVEDDLPQKLLIELRRRLYADPYGRSSTGEIPAIERIGLEEVRAFYQRDYRPGGAIMSVAGKFEWPALCDKVAALLEEWPSTSREPLVETPPLGGYEHISQDSTQTHIGVAFSSVPYTHPQYYEARGAIGVLSDGMSSRLFTEVREKRGLCYTVYASCHSLRDRGSVLCYSATSAERAQETVDVILAELARLTEGVEQEELDRLKARLKTVLIMQQESSSARSRAIASDWYHLDRLEPLEEVARKVEELTVEKINRYLGEHPPGPYTMVTVGPEPLEVRDGISPANA